MSNFVELAEGDNIDIDLDEITAIRLAVETEQLTVKSTESVQKFYPSEGKYFDEVIVDSVALDKPDQTKTTIPSRERQVVRADVGYELAENIVEPIPNNYNDTTDATATASDIAQGKTAYTKDGLTTGTLTNWLQWKLDNTKDARYIFYNYDGVFPEGLLESLDFSNVEKADYAFEECSGTFQLPELNFASCKSANNMCKNCERLSGNVVIKGGAELLYATSMFDTCRMNLESVQIENTSKLQSASYMFNECRKLKSVSTIDMLNVQYDYSSTNMFDYCSILENLVLKNIKVNLQIGRASNWGYLLTDESIINTAKELWDLTGSTSKRLTVSTTSNARFDAIYVKLITATDEMIAEDEYINNKKPCEVCESTDEGAMTLREYVVSKNWALA